MLCPEPGREEGSGEEGVAARADGMSLDMPLLCKDNGRALATESPRFRPVLAWTLHLLLTLSDRLIMALSTKPPRPLVGDGDRVCDRTLDDLVRSEVPSSAVLVSKLNGRVVVESWRLGLRAGGFSIIELLRAAMSGVLPRLNLSTSVWSISEWLS